MNRFHSITAKLGNMRKEDEFTIYPIDSANPDKVVIQSDKRICQVVMATGKAMISDGKGGHQGFMKLNPIFGGKEIDVPADVMEKLRTVVAGIRPGPAEISLCARNTPVSI